MQIKVNNLVQIFDRKSPFQTKAVDNVNLEISQGEYIGIIGQTGSGKTTFVEHLNALILPTFGRIEWIFNNEVMNKKTKEKNEFVDRRVSYNEKKYSRILKTKEKIKKLIDETTKENKKRKLESKINSLLIRSKKKIKKIKDIRKRVGIVFQFAEYQLFSETIEQDIAFGPMSLGVPKKEAYKKAAEYLKLVGMDESFLEKSPFGLSGGQKRRVALAGILAMEPDFIVADEPTAGLDPAGVQDILSIFDKMHEMGKTVIIITHDLDNVLKVAKRVLLFKDGKIVKDGDTFEILSNIKLLEENQLEPPQLLNLIQKIKDKGIDVPKITSIDELITFLKEYLANKQLKGGK